MHLGFSRHHWTHQHLHLHVQQGHPPSHIRAGHQSPMWCHWGNRRGSPGHIQSQNWNTYPSVPGQPWQYIWANARSTPSCSLAGGQVMLSSTTFTNRWWSSATIFHRGCWTTRTIGTSQTLNTGSWRTTHGKGMILTIPRWEETLVGIRHGKYNCPPFQNLTKTYWARSRNKQKHNQTTHCQHPLSIKIKQRQLQTGHMLVDKNR